MNIHDKLEEGGDVKQEEGVNGGVVVEGLHQPPL
jgi:hypothetical protein